jgi:hypothetical protein
MPIAGAAASFRSMGSSNDAIAMRNGYPFGLGGLWENWKDPASGEWLRTFAIITTEANELVAEIHNRARYWYQRGVKTAIASTTPALAERCGALRHAMGPQSAHPHIHLLHFFALRCFAVSFRCFASNRVRMCGSAGRNRVRTSTNCDAL